MRLVIVSNRLPFTVSFKDGTPEYNVSSGGLTTGLWSYLERGSASSGERLEFLWLGWPGASVPTEHEAAVRTYAQREFRALPIFLPEEHLPILQVYVDRLPGAVLEEKEFSLAWHYRRADPELAARRARELLDDVAGFTRNVDVQVLEGNKVLEVRNSGVNKGTAATEWLASRGADFILAIGDDWADEDLFRALPPEAYSVRVGLANTAARYYLNSPTAVRRLLRELTHE